MSYNCLVNISALRENENSIVLVLLYHYFKTTHDNYLRVGNASTAQKDWKNDSAPLHQHDEW